METKMLWLILLIVLLVFIYLKVLKPYRFWINYEVCHTKPWPVFGHMGKFCLGMTALGELVQNFYNKFPDKRYFGFYQFLKPTLVLRDIDLIKQITIKDFDSFTDRREFIGIEDDPLFGKSLFSLTGRKWKNMRTTLSPAFSGSKIRSMFILMSDCAEQFTNHLATEFNEDETVKSVEMKDMFSRYTNDVIASCAFGIKCDSLLERDNEFFINGKETTDFTGIKTLKFFGYTLSPTLMRFFSVRLFDDKVSSFFRNIVMSNVKTREENEILRPDMIHLLMEARKGSLKHEGVFKPKDSGFATFEESEVDKQIQNVKPDWDDDDITSQAMFFFFAGFETSSTMLCHMVNELALNENIQKRLQDEIDATNEECNGKVTYEALLKMKYMDMVASESLRKWPPVPFVDRNCVKPYTLQPTEAGEKPLKIEIGVNIWIPIYGIQRDPIHFPDPERFDPERFNDENKDNIRPFSYLPFGIGPRGCIGSRFALLEAKIVFFYLLAKFDIAVVKETQIPLKLKKLQFNLLAENGFWVGLKLRKDIK